MCVDGYLQTEIQFVIEQRQEAQLVCFARIWRGIDIAILQYVFAIGDIHQIKCNFVRNLFRVDAVGDTNIETLVRRAKSLRIFQFALFYVFSLVDGVEGVHGGRIGGRRRK